MIQSFQWPIIDDLFIQILRLDTNDPLISGNKFYKLKPWLEKARSLNAGLMSCGGAYSNHLHALAAAGYKYNIPTFALVRGMEPENLTVTLADCRDMGMQLLPMTREQYAKRYDAGFADAFLNRYDQQILWVPEGGTDEAAVVACEGIGIELNSLLASHHFDSVWLAVGSGGTLAGIARSLQADISLFAVPVVKHWDDVRQHVNQYLDEQQAQRIHWVDNADYGGFGRLNEKHLAFMAKLEQVSQIPFDPVYTSKLMRRLIELTDQKKFSGQHPLAIHTGGLQGRRSVADRLDKMRAVKAGS